MSLADACRVPVQKLRRTCEPKELDFETTADVPPLEGWIGQNRGVNAINFGVSIPTPGYNLYVAGAVGTGRSSTVLSIVRGKAARDATPDDWCYVNDFKGGDEPRAIRLPKGFGRELARDMEELITDCKTEIPKAFESEEYERRKEEALQAIQEKRTYLFSSLEQRAERLGFTIQLSKTGVATVPVLDGKPIDQEGFEKLSDEQKARIQENSQKVQEEVARVLTEIRKLEKEAKDKLRTLDRQIALFAVGHLLESLKVKYADFSEIRTYLDEVQRDVIDNIETFKSDEGDTPEFLGMKLTPAQSRHDAYRVNLLVDNSTLEGAPVVVEPNPTYDNLFGRLEYKGRFGTMTTDFHMIKPGAVHKANGGYLVLQALDVLKNPFAWDGLKRVIRSGEARVESAWEQFRAIPVSTLRPEPIPVKLKVIMIGSTLLYHLLHMLDEDFQRLFKVKAQFDVEMDWDEEHVGEYSAFVSSMCKGGDLLPLDRSAVAAVVEYGSWLSGDQQKLSTRFMEIAEAINEASYWAQQAKSDVVKAEHVHKAIDEKRYRSNMIEEKIQELIDEGTLFIDTTGSVEAQVNGLSIYDLGDYAFGKPSRITATTALGTKGVMNIEREAKMSGKIHSKGVMILSAYLARKFGHNKPLCVSATLCFEQLYDEVEGDSASSTELYALLSSLSGLPLKQNLAVTGSVNQKGEIQPVGGVTRKIEGFFDVCRAKGLTGDQGVIVPAQNVKNLMVRHDVVEAVQQGTFHIYAIKAVEEGIELLTGVPAGKIAPDGSYPEDTVFGKVDAHLQEMAEQIKQFQARGEEKKEEEE